MPGTPRYAVAVRWPTQGEGWVDRAFDANEDPYANHSAWTTHADRAKRWKTRYGANVNAARYERWNPPARAEAVRIDEEGRR